MPARPIRPIRFIAIIFLLCSTWAVSRGDGPLTHTQTSNQCGQSNPDGPCYSTGGLPECFNSNGRCVGTEQLCRFDWVAGGSCSNGVCQADGTCRPNGGGTTTSTDCSVTACPVNQRCVANKCVPTSTVVPPRARGCTMR